MDSNQYLTHVELLKKVKTVRRKIQCFILWTLFFTHILVLLLCVLFINNFVQLRGIPQYANVSCVLYLIRLLSYEWPDDGPL
jgi:uncharacterized membrane protein YqjE